jgi:hypothetical protein
MIDHTRAMPAKNKILCMLTSHAYNTNTTPVSFLFLVVNLKASKHQVEVNIHASGFFSFSSGKFEKRQAPGRGKHTFLQFLLVKHTLN